MNFLLLLYVLLKLKKAIQIYNKCILLLNVDSVQPANLRTWQIGEVYYRIYSKLTIDIVRYYLQWVILKWVEKQS